MAGWGGFQAPVSALIMVAKNVTKIDFGVTNVSGPWQSASRPRNRPNG